MSFKFFDLDSWHEFRSLLKIFSWVNFLILFSQCFRWAFSGGVTNTKAGLCYNFFVYPQDFTSLRDFMETSHAFPVTGLTLRFESFWNYNDIIVFPGFFVWALKIELNPVPSFLLPLLMVFIYHRHCDSTYRAQCISAPIYYLKITISNHAFYLGRKLMRISVIWKFRQIFFHCTNDNGYKKTLRKQIKCK